MKRLFFLIFSLVFANSLFAQSPREIERRLIKKVDALQKYSTYAGKYDEVLTPRAQEKLKSDLLKYAKRAATLKYTFPELSKRIFIATSPDGKFRVYSWNDEAGGTMKFFERVYQFQGARGKVYSQAAKPEGEGDAGSFVYEIFQFDSKRERIYIVCSTFIGSTRLQGQSANLFKISGESLKDKVNLIKTKEGLTDSLSFSYNFFSVFERKERPIKLFLFDEKTKTLKFPVVVEDDNFPDGRVTDNFIFYKFDGRYFVKLR